MSQEKPSDLDVVNNLDQRSRTSASPITSETRAESNANTPEATRPKIVTESAAT